MSHLPLRVKARTRAAQHGPYSGDEFPRAERLGDVVVGAHRQADEFVDLLYPRGEHDDVAVREGTHRTANLDPIDPRQPEIEDDHARIQLPGQGDCLRPLPVVSTSNPSRSKYLATNLASGASSSTTSTRGRPSTDIMPPFFEISFPGHGPSSLPWSS